MGIADRLKELRSRAAETAVEHGDKLHDAVQKVTSAADARTGGRYSEHIQKAGAAADGLVESLKREAPPGNSPASGAPGESPAGGPQG